MSEPPCPPLRFDPKYKRVPSRDKLARLSVKAGLAEFTLGPNRNGADHGTVTAGRTADQMSGAPPWRVESKKISRPSLRTFGRASSYAEFNSLTGVAALHVPSGFCTRWSVSYT